MPDTPTTANHGAEPQTPHWSDIRESGTLLGLRFMYRLHRVIGRRGFSLVLWIIGFWYALTRPLQRRCSLEFLRSHAQRYPEQWPQLKAGQQPGWWHVVRHFQCFGESVLDKSLAWTHTPKEEDFTLLNASMVRQTLADPRGQVVIGSHFGNLEYCRGFLEATHARTVNVLVYDRHSAKFVAAMARYSPDSRLNVYQVDELDFELVLALKARTDRGEWVFIAGDRIPLSGEKRTASVPFLGREALLPTGPYILARTLACPVKLMFAWRDGNRVYFDLQAFAEHIDLPRGQREAALDGYAEQFAAALEGAAAKAPYQWFNFYPFWGTVERD